VLTAAISWGHLGQVVYVSLISAIVATALFSFTIYGGTRASEARRDRNHSAATAYGILAAVSFALFAGCIVAAIAVIVNK
jgi:hypothetical protein